MSNGERSVSDQELSDLVQDLEEMLRYVEQAIERLGQLSGSAEADWKGPAAAAHKKLQRDAYRDAARIRQLLLHVEQTAKERGESPSQRYLDLRHRFQALQLSPG